MSNALISMFAIMAGGMLLRAPISFSMLAGGIGYLVIKGQDVGLMAEQILNGLYNSYVLLAVPLFILAASIMNAGAISERLFAMAISVLALGEKMTAWRSAAALSILAGVIALRLS